MPIVRPELDRALNRQLRRWRNVEARRRPTRDIDLNVIAISRQTGSGGKLIAARVSQTLELPYYDREIIRRMAENVKAQGGDVGRDDGLELTSDLPYPSALQSYESLDGTLRHLDLPPEQYREHLGTVMHDIADGEGGVVLGRGANFMLPRDRCLRVRVVAPLEIRTDYVASMFQIPVGQARTAAQEKDADRRLFNRNFFDADIDEPTNYDLVLNMDLYSLDAAVVMVLQAWSAARHIWCE